MKTNFLSLIFLYLVFFNATNVFAKKDTTIVFCNESLYKVKKKYAQYYIKVFRKKDGEIGVLQYNRDNFLYMKGSFRDEKLKIKHGAFEYYTDKGIIKEKGHYENNKKEELWLIFAKNRMIISKGYYQNNKKNGLWEYFMENGVLTSKGEYLKGKRTGSWVFYDNTGSMTDKSNYIHGKLSGEELKWYKDTLTLVGEYELGEKIGFWQSWYNNRNVNYAGRYNLGKREGEWEFYFMSGEFAALEVYENGDVIDAKWFDEDGNPVKPIEPYELSPKFPGEEYAMNTHIQNTFEYPEIARELGEQGRVWVEFFVYTDGVIRDVKVVVSVSPSIDAEAIRVIKLMPNWIPGLNHNRKMPIRYTVPIRCLLG